MPELSTQNRRALRKHISAAAAAERPARYSESEARIWEQSSGAPFFRREGWHIHELPFGNPNSFPPLAVDIGIPLNELIEDIEIFRSVELVKLESLTAQSVGRVFRDAAAQVLGRALSTSGAVTAELNAELAQQLARTWSAATGKALADVEASLFAALEQQGRKYSEIADAWNSYAQHPEFRTLPNFIVPPVEGFIEAVTATDPNWFMHGLFENESARTIITARNHVLSAFVSGDSTQQLATRLRNTFNLSRHRAESMSRTALHRVSRRMQRRFVRENRDIVKRERWTATLDNRTCPICGNYDGRTWKIGSGPEPPAHGGCRCDRTPVTRSVREILGMKPVKDEDPLRGLMRESMDGLTPARKTWGEWITAKERQNPGFALDIFGRSRYDAWVAGTIGLPQLTRGGKVRTLQSLGI